MSTAIVEPKSEVTNAPAEPSPITKPKDWVLKEEFLFKPEATLLYDQMMKQPWIATGDDSSAIHYGLSYQEKGGVRPDEIPEIPAFLKAFADRVSIHPDVQAPVNYIQCHRYGPGKRVSPHADPTGMIVPMLVVGQERTFRVGGRVLGKNGKPFPRMASQKSMKNGTHIPEDEYLLQHGSLLVFNGGYTFHSMDPANGDKDPQANLRDFKWRISLLFRWTTPAMREHGPEKSKRKEYGGLQQYADAINEFRAALANGSLQQGNLFESSVTPATPTAETESIVKPWHKYCDQSSWHEAANIFPLMPGNELQKLADDIKANGLKNPIVLLNDKVLDGRNRLLACKLAGVTPDFQPRDAETLGSPVSWVLSQNIRRRQLTTTQRAFIAVEAEKLFAIEAKQRQVATQNNKTAEAVKANLPEQVTKGQARDQAAKALDVSPRYVQDAKAIATKSPEIAAQAKAGKVSMAEAKHATQPAPTPPQASVAASGPAQVAATFATKLEEIFGGGQVKVEPTVINRLGHTAVCPQHEYGRFKMTLLIDKPNMEAMIAALSALVNRPPDPEPVVDPTPSETPAASPLAAEPQPALPPFALTSPCDEPLPHCKHEAHLLTPEESLAFFDELFTLPWKQHNPNRGPVPRMVAWMGVPPNPESYTGRTPIVGGGTLKPVAWMDAALAIKKKVENFTRETFDCLNLNLYRDNKDYVDWHADDADEGLWTASIASVSLGATRTFQVRHGNDGKPLPWDVKSGSLVVMPPGYQRDWLHCLAKTAKPCGPRINLTFRRMIPTAQDVQS